MDEKQPLLQLERLLFLTLTIQQKCKDDMRAKESNQYLSCCSLERSHRLDLVGNRKQGFSMTSHAFNFIDRDHELALVYHHSTWGSYSETLSCI